MEAAFAAGGTPVGLSAPMHAAALAWTPPGFAAFDTGRTADEADDGVRAETPRAADTAGTESPPQPEPAQPPAPTEANGAAEAAEAAPPGGGNGHAAPAAPEPGPPDGDAENAGGGALEATDADPPDDREQDGIAGPAGPLNGRGPADDPLEIPEFLRRAH